ncbi:MAG: apolipoprotein N-acyltransferase [Kiritimatiellae bacterium]|nr:apolipoprotein N-acyltransferase [Kiritimatiellia bacterium]
MNEASLTAQESTDSCPDKKQPRRIGSAHLFTLWRLAGALSSGFILAAAFPPAGEWESAWVGLIPLILVARFSLPRHAFSWGFLAGCVFWLPSLSWLLRLSANGGPVFLVGLGWILLSGYCALYMGLFLCLISWGLRRLLGSGSPQTSGAIAWRRLLSLVMIPVIWVATEYMRSTLLTGFPWNALGVSQYGNLSVVQVAAWGGVYAVSAVVVIMNTALALTCLDLFGRTQEKRRRFRPELATGLLLCLACWISGTRTVATLRTQRVEPEVRVAAVQPAVVQAEKWEARTVENIFERLAGQTRLALIASPQLVVWPETALPGPLPHDEQSARFAAELAGEGVPILVGAMEVSQLESEVCCWNSSFLYGVDGVIMGRYRKKHLVPFGEYIPFDRLIPSLQRWAPLGVSCVPGERMKVFSLPGTQVRLSPLICFEDVFPELSREAVQAGANLLINQTNDAWFDGSSGSVQHMSHAIFRCVENRRPMVRASNTGITCHIDRTGKARILLGSDEDAELPGFAVYGVSIPTDTSGSTVYTRFGDWGFALPCVILMFIQMGIMVRESRLSRKALSPA